MASFYIIWSPGPCAKNPTFRHMDYSLAQKEAERLALQHPGDEFYVMLAASKSKKVEVSTQPLANIDHDEIAMEIPF